MQVRNDKILIGIFIFCTISFLSGQENKPAFGSANMCLQEQIEIEIKNSTIEKEPLIIINGQSVESQKEFDILKNIECSEIKEIVFMSSEKSKMKFDGERARRGIVLVSLTKRGGRIWKKNYKLID